VLVDVGNSETFNIGDFAENDGHGSVFLAVEANQVSDVDVEDVIALDGEDGIFNVVVIHVYSDWVSASDVLDVWLVFDMDSGFDVVSCAEAVTWLEVIVEVSVVGVAFYSEDEVAYALVCELK